MCQGAKCTRVCLQQNEGALGRFSEAKASAPFLEALLGVLRTRKQAALLLARPLLEAPSEEASC